MPRCGVLGHRQSRELTSRATEEVGLCGMHRTLSMHPITNHVRFMIFSPRVLGPPGTTIPSGLRFALLPVHIPAPEERVGTSIMERSRDEWLRGRSVGRGCHALVEFACLFSKLRAFERFR